MKHIAILKQDFNGVEMNSIDARQLHEKLGIKKAFTTWITTALDNTDSTDGENYQRLKVSLEGSGYKWQYILSLDLASHIAMMSKSKKAEEIRQYFIDVQKQVNNSSQLVPKKTMEILKVMFTAMEEQQEDINENKQQIAEVKEEIRTIKEDARLTTHEERDLIDAKNRKVYEIAKDDKPFATKLHRKVWTLFKKKFLLSKYNALERGKLQDGLDYINNLTFSDMVA